MFVCGIDKKLIPCSTHPADLYTTPPKNQSIIKQMKPITKEEKK